MQLFASNERSLLSAVYPPSSGTSGTLLHLFASDKRSLLSAVYPPSSKLWHILQQCTASVPIPQFMGYFSRVDTPHSRHSRIQVSVLSSSKLSSLFRECHK